MTCVFTCVIILQGRIPPLMALEPGTIKSVPICSPNGDIALIRKAEADTKSIRSSFHTAAG